MLDVADASGHTGIGIFWLDIEYIFEFVAWVKGLAKLGNWGIGILGSTGTEPGICHPVPSWGRYTLEVWSFGMTGIGGCDKEPYIKQIE